MISPNEISVRISKVKSDLFRIPEYKTGSVCVCVCLYIYIYICIMQDLRAKEEKFVGVNYNYSSSKVSYKLFKHKFCYL